MSSNCLFSSLQKEADADRIKWFVLNRSAVVYTYTIYDIHHTYTYTNTLNTLFPSVVPLCDEHTHTTHTFIEMGMKKKDSKTIEFNDKEISRLNHSNQWYSDCVWCDVYVMCASHPLFFYSYKASISLMPYGMYLFDLRSLRLMANFLYFIFNLCHKYKKVVLKRKQREVSLPPLQTALFHNFFLYLIFVPVFAWFSKIITSADELYWASLTFQAIECIHQFCDWFETFRFHCIMMTTIVRHNLCLIVLKIWFLFQSWAFLFVKPNLIK